MITQTRAFDVAIRRVRLIDGSGTPSRLASVYLRDGLIAAIEERDHDFSAEVSHEADGLALAPGFIDVHTHDDVALVADPQMRAKATQGVTSVVTGLCGYSPAPLPAGRAVPDEYAILLDGPHRRWARFADYLQAVEAARPAVNWLPLVGHSSLRIAAVDDLARPATDGEIAAMRALLEEALDAGAAGLSSGLAYAMARAASTEELVRLCEPLTRVRGAYVTHLRDEGDGLLASVAEALEIGRRSGAPVIFSHHKALGCRNHGLTRESLALIDSARPRQRVALDAYPYTFSSTSLTRERAARGGEVVVTRSETMPEAAGRSLDVVAAELGCDRLEAVDRLAPAGALYHLMSEADVRRVLGHELTMIGSDGLPFDPIPHPRLWGTFPRVLSRYVCEDPLFSLEEAVRRMTSLPAAIYRLERRGLVRPGHHADLVLFDPEIVRDRADCTNPTAPADGIALVLVGGVPATRGTGRRLRSAP